MLELIRYCLMMLHLSTLRTYDLSTYFSVTFPCIVQIYMDIFWFAISQFFVIVFQLPDTLIESLRIFLFSPSHIAIFTRRSTAIIR